MARRGGTVRFPCADGNCGQAAVYDYSTRADYDRLLAGQRQRPWRCARHRAPDEVLSPENHTRTTVLTAERSKRHDSPTLFWREDGHEFVSTGLVDGPGFKAWANDFPEGTRLTVTVTVEPPPMEAAAGDVVTG